MTPRARRVLLSVAVSGLVALAAAEASATPTLRVPWPCDVTYRITQGHNGGSHTGFGGWAWDIGIPVGGEVVAPADGTVRLVRMDSMTGGCDSSYGNDANYVVIAFGDGTEALLLHLEAFSTNLQPGAMVRQGDVVGRVGLTGWVCGAHLHFQIQQTCGSWWCQSIQASFETFGDPVYDTYITSDNCGGPPPVCGVRLAGGSHTVDEQDTTCFDRFTSYWWSVGEGDAGHHYYTFATDAAQPETWGRWRFHVDQPGDYRVEVFVPATEADSQTARYQIDTGAGTVSSGPVNQAAQKGWVDLGVYNFAAGADRSVSLADNTGENYSQFMRKVAFDAVRLTRVEAPPLDEAPADTSAPDTGMPPQDTSLPPDDTGLPSDTGSPGDTAAPGDTGFPADTAPGGDTGVGPDGTIGPAPDAAMPDGGSDGGGDAAADDGGLTQDLPDATGGACACAAVRGATSDGHRAPLAALAVLALVGLRLRRRSRGDGARGAP